MTINFPDLRPAAPVTPGSGLARLARHPYRHGLKRLIDVAAVLMAAPFVVPLVAGLALAVRRDGGGAFYCQDRLGKDGRRFRIWKLRTMVPDADQQLARHLSAHPAARTEWDATQKLRHDPRITPLGHLLRRSSLDELPQLWNVLRGDMSLVGPRPMMPDQQPLYPGTAYFRLRPGITGAWQVSERHQSTFAARADYDAAYDRDLSLATDAAILMRTVGVVLRGTGC